MLQFVFKGTLGFYLRNLLNHKFLPVYLIFSFYTTYQNKFFKSGDDIDHHNKPVVIIPKTLNQPRQLLAETAQRTDIFSTLGLINSTLDVGLSLF